MSESAQANGICYHHLVVDLTQENERPVKYRKSLLNQYRQQANDSNIGLKRFNDDLKEGKLIQFTVAHHREVPTRMGIAACSKRDSFSRQLGNKIAEGRLVSIDEVSPVSLVVDAVGFPHVQRLQDKASNTDQPTYTEFLNTVKKLITSDKQER